MIKAIISVLYGVIANDGMYIEYSECIRQCADWEGELTPAHISSLFAQGDRVNFQTFSTWIEKNYEVRIAFDSSLNVILQLAEPKI